MNKIKIYSFESEFDFGQCKGQKIKDVFDKTPAYINWCFQKIDWFCITDEIFNKLPIIIALRKDNKLDDRKEQKDWLKILTELHNYKKSKLNSNNHFEQSDNREFYSDENWLEEVSETNDPETMNAVY